MVKLEGTKAGRAAKADGTPEPDAGKAAFKAHVEREFKAKLEEKELDSFRDVRGGASHDPGMQARQAAAAEQFIARVTASRSGSA